MELSEQIQHFLTYVEVQRHFSPRTVDTYRKSLHKFVEHLGAGNVAGNVTGNVAVALEAFTETNVKSFVWNLKIKQGLAPTSICEHLAALKSFGKYLVRSKILSTNPAGNVPMPKRPKRLVNFMSQKDLSEEKFPELENPTLPQLRARLLLELIYGSGLRISECQGLRWNQIQEKERLVRVIGKGNKERIVPVTEALLARIGEFKQKQAEAGRVPSPTGYVFLSDDGKPFGLRTLRNDIHDLLRDIGWGARLAPTFCATALQRTCWRTAQKS